MLKARGRQREGGFKNAVLICRVGRTIAKPTVTRNAPHTAPTASLCVLPETKKSPSLQAADELLVGGGKAIVPKAAADVKTNLQ
jgi:hypothetical protein